MLITPNTNITVPNGMHLVTYAFTCLPAVGGSHIYKPGRGQQQCRWGVKTGMGRVAAGLQNIDLHGRSELI